MKYDYTTNSYYLALTFLYILSLGVNGFALNSSAETGSQAKRIRPARVFYADKVKSPSEEG